MPIATTLVSSPALEIARQSVRSNTKVAIAGIGAIGVTLLRHLARGDVPGMEIVGVAVRDRAKAHAMIEAIGADIAIVELSQLAEIADIVVECVPATLLDQVVRPVLMAAKKAIVLSVGGLLGHYDLIELARATGGQIIVPTGALLGLDAVCAAAEGKIHSVTMVTRKPIAGLLGAPYLVENGIDISKAKEPMRVFKGTARDAAKGFPANLNVAVALSLAGIGPDRTTLEIWADPAITRNTHRILVDSDAARIDMTIENIPSENPKTGRITALSVLSTLRKLNAALRVGS
jgi:aspartate dehydrogenase